VKRSRRPFSPTPKYLPVVAGSGRSAGGPAKATRPSKQPIFCQSGGSIESE